MKARFITEKRFFYLQALPPGMQSEGGAGRDLQCPQGSKRQAGNDGTALRCSIF